MMASKRILGQFNSKSFRAFSSTITVPLNTKVDTYLLEESVLPKETTTTGEELIKYFKDMYTMRRMEVQCDQLYKNREIRGFLHLYDGQESVAQGIEEGITLQDHIISAYRIHCQAVAPFLFAATNELECLAKQYKRGISLYKIFAEMLQKKDGASKGRGGSMHFYNSKQNFWGGNGIVGAQVPVGAGIAFAMKYKNQPNVCITMYGDGAANQGQVFEAANISALWKLPVIFVCENNKYGMGTSLKRAHATQEIFKRLNPVPGIRFDASSVFTVREITKFSKKYAIENGPICLEMLTYRYHGHSMSDPGISYRTREEIMERRKMLDPINIVSELITSNNVATEKDLKDIQKEINSEIEEAIIKAKAAPEPGKEELITDVFAEDGYYIRGPNFEDSVFPDSKF